MAVLYCNLNDDSDHQNGLLLIDEVCGTVAWLRKLRLREIEPSAVWLNGGKPYQESLFSPGSSLPVPFLSSLPLSHPLLLSHLPF